MPDIELLIYTPQELNQSSYFHAGLFELQKQGFLRCKVVIDVRKNLGRIDTSKGTPVRTGHAQGKTSYYKLVAKKTGREIPFAVDLYDVPWFFPEHALITCDYVFKRNYVASYIDPLDHSFKRKISPLGLSFRVRPEYEGNHFLLLVGLLISNLRISLTPRSGRARRVYNSLVTNIRHWKSAMTVQTLREFETRIEAKEENVIFQTRCFPRSDDKDAREIHLQRAGLIRILRARLSNRFIGGFVHSTVAKKYFPDCLTNLPSNQQEYLQKVKSSAIGVYTRGLSYSPAWKLAEYMSQGICIVAEPLLTELPVALEDGRHLYYFRKPDECAEICESLLGDQERRERIGSNARRYYEENVHPASNVKRIIDFMLTDNKYSA
jgi:glycosyltransferase involved in cell wall biosynthesis